jgi:hypothetical protein
MKSDAKTTAGRRFLTGAKQSSITINVVVARPVTKIQGVPGRWLLIGAKGIPEAAVVLMVSVAVPVVVPADRLIGPPTVQVGGSVALDAVTAHVSATAPVNPPVPVAVMVEVPD